MKEKQECKRIRCPACGRVSSEEDLNTAVRQHHHIIDVGYRCGCGAEFGFRFKDKPVCETCGKESDELDFGADSKLVCPVCSAAELENAVISCEGCGEDICINKPQEGVGRIETKTESVFVCSCGHKNVLEEFIGGEEDE